MHATRWTHPDEAAPVDPLSAVRKEGKALKF